MRLLLLAAALACTAAPALAQNPSADATYETLRLDEYFDNDPRRVDLVAGGPVDVSKPGCGYGYVASAPDVKVYYETEGDQDLYFYAVASEDTILLINLPDGSWVCDDDSYDDGDPLVGIAGAPGGRYDVWVGTFGEETVAAALFVSEVDPR